MKFKLKNKQLGFFLNPFRFLEPTSPPSQYIAPIGDSVTFNYISTQSYVEPTGNSVNFNFNN